MAEQVKETSATTCPECSRLWDEFTKATKDQLLLMERMSGLRKDFEQVQELELQIETAATVRERAWRKIEEHEASAHGRKHPRC